MNFLDNWSPETLRIPQTTSEPSVKPATTTSKPGWLAAEGQGRYEVCAREAFKKPPPDDNPRYIFI